MAIAPGQESFGLTRIEEIIETCRRQGRLKAVASFQPIADRLRSSKGRIEYDDLTLLQQETVDWVESLGNRQS